MNPLKNTPEMSKKADFRAEPEAGVERAGQQRISDVTQILPNADRIWI